MTPVTPGYKQMIDEANESVEAVRPTIEEFETILAELESLSDTQADHVNALSQAMS